MDSTCDVAGSLGPYSYHRVLRVARNATLAVLGNPCVCVCLVAVAVWWHAVMIIEATPSEPLSIVKRDELSDATTSRELIATAARLARIKYGEMYLDEKETDSPRTGG